MYKVKFTSNCGCELEAWVFVHETGHHTETAEVKDAVIVKTCDVHSI